MTTDNRADMHHAIECLWKDKKLTDEEAAALRSLARFLVACRVVRKPVAYLIVTGWSALMFWEEVGTWFRAKFGG